MSTRITTPSSDSTARRQFIKLTVGARLALSYALLVLIMIILGAMAYFSTIQTAKIGDEVAARRDDLALLSQLQLHLVDQYRYQTSYIVTSDAAKMDAYQQSLDEMDVVKERLRGSHLAAHDDERGVDEGELSAGMEEMALLDEIDRLGRTYNAVYSEGVLPAVPTWDQEKIDALLAQSDALLSRMDLLIGQLAANLEAEVVEATVVANQATFQTRMLSIALLVLGPLLGVLSSAYFGRYISQPIGVLTKAAREAADGDLEQSVVIPHRDELGVLAGAFNRMVGQLREILRSEQREREYLQATVQSYVEYAVQVGGGDLSARLTLDGEGRDDDDPLIQLGQQLNWTSASLQRIIQQIGEAAGNLSSASAEILASTAQQLSSASEQSAAISQTTTTVDEVRNIAEQVVARAQEVADTAQRSVEFSRAGEGAVGETIESMAGIKQRVEGIAENILALSEQTQQIGNIIATVDDIASQSNMLALNASVEAARAGEQGKGFAVVAMEVRSLAEQSKQATTQIEEILSEIQKATNMTVMATEEGTKGVEEGVNLSAKTGDVIQQLGSVITQSAQAAVQMVAGGQQQTSGIEQIALAMANINQATVQSLASTRQAEKAARDLNELAQSLIKIVEQYR